MATIAKGKAIWAGSLYDSGAPVKEWPEAATQTFERGEILAVNVATGRVAIPAIIATDLLDISTVIGAGNGDRVAGVATKKAAAVTGTTHQVQLIRPGDFLEMTLVQGTVSPGTDHVSAQADIGATVSLLRDSAAKAWYATTDVTEPAGKIIGGGYGGGRGVLGDTNIRVQVVLTPGMLLTAPYTEIV